MKPNNKYAGMKKEHWPEPDTRHIIGQTQSMEDFSTMMGWRIRTAYGGGIKVAKLGIAAESHSSQSPDLLSLYQLSVPDFLGVHRPNRSLVAMGLLCRRCFGHIQMTRHIIGMATQLMED